MFDVNSIREQFPILKRQFHGQPLIYLDSAATTLKPKVVVDAVSEHSLYATANVHRGAYALSNEATEKFEKARQAVAGFLGAEADEIIFTKGTTESINLIAQTWGRQNLKSGDKILLTVFEHHANIVPWQMLAESKNLKIEVVKMDQNGDLDQQDFLAKIPDTKLFAFTACSNHLGIKLDVKKLSQIAHQHGAVTLVDAAQAVSGHKIDVRDGDMDFLVFSAHKLFAPTGLGVVFGKKALLHDLPPWQGGGSMISQVSFEKTTYNEAPFRFEAGTPHIEGVIGLHAALDWFTKFDRAQVITHEMDLHHAARQQLSQIGGIKFYESSTHKAPILSFNIEGAHHSDVAQILDQQGVAVRAGHHCTQPLLKELKVQGTLRASFSIYNQISDVEKLCAAVKKAKDFLL